MRKILRPFVLIIRISANQTPEHLLTLLFLSSFIASSISTCLAHTLATNSSSNADTLRRSDLIYNLHDTLALRSLRPSVEDTFSSVNFTAFKGITTFN